MDLKARRLKCQALRQENLNFSNPNSHPWFVSGTALGVPFNNGEILT
jgi:hypothetical protein